MKMLTAAACAAAMTLLACEPGIAQTVVTAPVAIAATPATQEAVQTQAWWAGLADQLIAALAAALIAAVPIVLAWLRTFIATKSKVAAAAYDRILADKLHDGAIAIINGEAEKLKQAIAAKATGVGTELVAGQPAEPATRAAIVAAAQPKVEAVFADTLKHFGKSGSQLTDYLQARVEPALNGIAASVKPLPYPLSKAP